MSELPKGWVEAELGDVCTLLNGRAYKKSELLHSGKYPVLRVGNFFTNLKWYYSDLELEDNKYCDTGDLLYAWSASFGPQIWLGGKVIYHYHIWRVDLLEAVVVKGFLYNWFHWDKENIKATHGTGSTMIHVTKRDMEKRSIALPPLVEQKRIVAKLDSLSARSARARNELARIDSLVKRYKQAVLSKAFAGELTECDVAEWQELTIRDLLEDIRYGTSKKCDVDPKLTPVLRIPNISNGMVDLKDLKHADFDDKELAKLRLRKEDLLVIRSNGSLDLVGRSAVVGSNAEGMLFAGYLIRIRLNLELVEPRFLHFGLQAPEMRKHVESLAKSTSGVNNINSQQIQGLSLRVPSLDEQQEIVHRIESAFQKIDKLAVESKRALRLTDKLDEAILSKAFRGELVPQDPNEEPASVLLDRVKSSRGTSEETVLKRQNKDRQKSYRRKSKVVDKKRQDVSENYLREIILEDGGRISPKELLKRSEMGLDEFYKQLRLEIEAGSFFESEDKDELVLRT